MITTELISAGRQTSTPEPSAPTSPDHLGATSAVAASVLLAGVGSATHASGATSAVGNTIAPSKYIVPISKEQAARFLLQAQFSASDAEIAAVCNQGYAAWLAQQFKAPASISGFDWLESRGYSVVNHDTGFYGQRYPGNFMIMQQLMTATDAVRKRAALALSEVFPVSISSLNLTWPGQVAAAYWDVLVRNAFGNFRKLLEDVTLNVAMGYFLGVRGNLKENPAIHRVPDENYAREVMQLFTLGVYQLNLDGTVKTAADGSKLESYTQADITNLARVFTGWNDDQTQNTNTIEPVQKRTICSTTYARLPMRLDASKHSTLESTFLGVTVPANTAGAAALKIALDTLFHHPNVGPFFGKQMIQRLVTSNPSPAYVARVASAFNNNGAGVRGDLQAVFAAVLLDDEARGTAGLSQPGFGKLREPMLRFVQWGRTFGVSSARGSWKIGNLSNPATQLGQSPLEPPSVFNFFRPGYVPPSTVLSAAKIPAPEFQIVDETSVVGYLNYMESVIRNGIHVDGPDVPQVARTAASGYDIKANYAAELALVADANALVNRLNLLLCAGQLSTANQAMIVSALNATAITATSNENARLDRIAAGIFLVMASADYLIQK